MRAGRLQVISKDECERRIEIAAGFKIIVPLRVLCTMAEPIILMHYVSFYKYS
jgi:hypothetical protein